MTWPARLPARLIAAALLAGFAGSAGAQTHDHHGTPPAQAPAQAPAQSTTAIRVEDPWARATVGRTTVGAAYLTIRAAAADQLVSVSTPVAARAELHNSVMDGTVMRMRPLATIDLAAGTPAVLQPSGMHIMLVDLRAPLRAGTTFPLTLQFARTGAVEVTVQVVGPRDRPQSGAHATH